MLVYFWGFILTMRNVNEGFKDMEYNVGTGFILTMRNVNLTLA